MNTSASKLLVLASLAVLASFGARADVVGEGTQTVPPFQGTLSRAEVQAELAQSRNADTSVWSREYNPLAQFKSSLSREQVRADYIAHRGEVAALNGEDSGSAYLARTAVRSVDRSTTLAGSPSRAE